MVPMARGLRFCAVDLHVHTPASKCFLGSVTPEEFVAQAIESGMKAIAVTDHNSGDWIDRIKAAAASTPLIVFPGVEISVQPGVHILAIFPEDRTSAHVNDLLARLGLGADARGDQEALVTQLGPQAVVSKICAEGALPILAHINDYKGAWKELSGQTRIQLWQAAEFAAVEIVGNQLPAEIGQAPYSHKPACYWSSDNPHPDDPTRHSHLGIGGRHSLFKLDEQITWEGLRLCFHDPTVRIRLEGVSTVQHPTINRVLVEGGFLHGLDLELNPNLNCIIGGRGTGKSTFLELIRHAFDVPPKTEANRQQAHSLVQNTFPAGARITVFFSTDGAEYRLERQAGQAPRVYREGESEPLGVAPGSLFPLQAYGQKEIYEISRDPQFQLRLLDNYVADAIRACQDWEKELVQALETNAAEIVRLKEALETAEEKLQRMGVVREELRRMEEQDFVRRLQIKNSYDREKRLYERAQGEFDKLKAELARLLESHRPAPHPLADLAGLPNEVLLHNEQQRLAAVDGELNRSIGQLVDRIQAIWDSGQAERRQWQTGYDEQEAVYQELLREFHGKGERLAPGRYVQLQQELSGLTELQTKVSKDRDRLDTLYGQRKEFLSQLRQVRQEQYRIRCRKAGELTQKLNQHVRITIHPQGNRAVYDEFLDKLCRGHRVTADTRQKIVSVEADRPEREGQRPVRVRGETQYLISRIPRYLDPIELAEAIRLEQNGDEGESVLRTRWQLSEAMSRNLARLSEEQLFSLELFAVPDLPIIELKVGGGQLAYRPLNALSIGQKCTALLGIVLLESAATLLIDQPEDDLDNQFIFDQIVDTLRREKERRQFVIATHNANIPVSADAELIVVVEADERRGRIGAGGVGSIDAAAMKAAVGRILEGGAHAFQIRREKYGLR
jgi:ABC-type lipoprotein export system ATPase subunit